MSNHYHLVLKLVPHEVTCWSDDEVLTRWSTLYRSTLLVQRHIAGDTLSEPERETVRNTVSVYRERLQNLSWFMKCLNEPIARKANREDSCTGHFWEARFHSQALRTEKALFGAMVYVDLNPVRAGSAETPEESLYTSIRARIRNIAGESTADPKIGSRLTPGHTVGTAISLCPLMPFSNADTGQKATDDRRSSLPMLEFEYIKLVDATGRVLRTEKTHSIDPSIAPILDRLGVSDEQWRAVSLDFRRHYRAGDVLLTQAA